MAATGDGVMDEPLLIPATTAVLMYHYVRPDDAPMRVGASRVDLETFAAQLDDLVRAGSIVGWPEVAAALSGGPQRPRTPSC